MMRWIIAGFVLAVVSGCGVVSTCDDEGGGIRLFGRDRVAQKLDLGVNQYEEGNYVLAMNTFQNVLEMKQASKRDKVRAYKYMAFIECISSREKLCHDYFSRILEIDPGFELSPAEIGHPIWGAIFRSVKLKPKAETGKQEPTGNKK